MFKLILILVVIYSALQFGLGVNINQTIEDKIAEFTEQAGDSLPELSERLKDQLGDALSSGQLEDLLQDQDLSLDNLTDLMEENDISMDKLNQMLEDKDLTSDAAKEKYEELKKRLQEKMENKG